MTWLSMTVFLGFVLYSVITQCNGDPKVPTSIDSLLNHGQEQISSKSDDNSVNPVSTDRRDCSSAISFKKASSNTNKPISIPSITQPATRHLLRQRRSVILPRTFSATRGKKSKFSFNAMRGRRAGVSSAVEEGGVSDFPNELPDVPQNIPNLLQNNPDIRRFDRASKQQMVFTATSGRRVAGNDILRENKIIPARGNMGALKDPREYYIIARDDADDDKDDEFDDNLNEERVELLRELRQPSPKNRENLKRFSPSHGTFSAMRGK